MCNSKNTNQINSNTVSSVSQNQPKKSNFFQNLLIIVLFTYGFVSFLMPEVTEDNYNSNISFKRVQDSKIPSYFEIYGEKADKAYDSEYKRYSNYNNEICNKYKNNIRNFANSLAAEKCTYSNCTKLIAYLAKDKVFGSDNGGDYLKDLFQYSINYKMNSFISDLNKNMSDYQSSMQQITQEYAYNICSNMPTASELYFDKNNNFNTPDFNIALSKLGVSGAFAIGAVGLEVGTLISTGFFSSLRKYIAQLAFTIFKAPIKKAAASVAVSAVDGPLPIGDILGAIGLAWTAYDISKMRYEFQEEVANSIYNKLYNEINNVGRQSAQSISKIHGDYQKIRLRMENNFKKEYAKVS